MTLVNMLVEGLLDEAVAIEIIKFTHHQPGVCYGKKGFGYIKEKIQGFNKGSNSSSCLALVDFMDTRLDCPAEVVSQWLPYRRPTMLFRVVVRELESWLLADHDNLAKYLHVHPRYLPPNPENLDDPKRELINIARHSQSNAIKSAIVPEPNSTAQVGRLYPSEMTNFIRSQWDISLARQRSPSLDRCITRLSEI